MNAMGRATVCLSLLAAGVAAQAGLESLSNIPRPPLNRPLASIPMTFDGWTGRDVPIDAEIRRVSQADDALSRAYANPRYPGVVLSLWVNYSGVGNNMWHSPEVCLPSHGWTMIESETKVVPVADPEGQIQPITRLGYQKEEQFQNMGFWYYVFGEGKVARWVRTLPITSRSSHGRTTRGSGMTVEVFWASEGDPESTAFRDFARALLVQLEPIMPANRAEYHVP